MPEGKVILEGVEKRYGNFEAVKNLDLTVYAGEFLTLLGPSGCGKTTTLMMIAGFEYPSRGRILLDGVDVTRTPPFLRNVNTVFQSYALFPHMKVSANVAFGLRVRKTPAAEAEARVQQALAMVQMQQFADRWPKQLSGGQQQRVALARALVLHPEVLLLDEPLGALDLKLRKEMQVELKHLQQKLGVTFLFVTHDQEEALTMSDRIVVMNHGCMEQVGTPTEIYERPRTRFVAEFIGETNLLPAADQGFISIRPERVRVAAHPGEPSVQVRVHDRIYVGSTVKIIGRTPEGTVLVATGAPGSSVALAMPGDDLALTWDPGDSVPLPAREGLDA